MQRLAHQVQLAQPWVSFPVPAIVPVSVNLSLIGPLSLPLVCPLSLPFIGLVNLLPIGPVGDP